MCNRFDQELHEFEKRLENDSKTVRVKLKPNISDEWINEIRQKISKIKMNKI